MKCQFCSNPATVHLTDIIDKKKKELHLCDACAQEHQITPGPKQELNVPAILQLLMGQPVQPAGEDARLVCAHCGLSYAQFRASGRLGCPEDYDAFRPVLEPILERIHRAVRHAGKAPRHRRSAAWHAELGELQRQIRAAVESERYEEAARLRDLVRRKEASDEP